MALPYELSSFLQQYLGTDEQGQSYSRYDPILFGPNYDINTGLTENQKKYGYNLEESGYGSDLGSDFLRDFEQNFPDYGSGPGVYGTAAQRHFGSDAGIGSESGYGPYAAFQQDLLSGRGEGYERALGLLNQAGFSQDEINAFLINMTGTAGRNDAFSLLGDQFFPAVGLFGLAAGGAGLYGAYAGAEAGAAGAGTAGLEGGSGAGLEGFVGSSTPLGASPTASTPALTTGGLETLTSPIPAGAVGPSTTPSLLTQAKLALANPTFGIAGAPTYAQSLQGLSTLNSLATLAQNPSAQGGLGLAGSLSGIPGAGTLGAVAGGGIDKAISSGGSSGTSGTGGTNVAEPSLLNSLAGLLPILGLAGYSLGANDGYAPSAKQETQIAFDPITQALNQFRLNQVQGAQNATGGLGNLLSPNNPAYQLSPQTQDLQAILTGQSYTPGLQPQDWYKQTEQGLGASYLQNRALNQNDFNAQLGSLQGNTQRNLAANQAYQANTTNLIPYGQDYLNQIVAPTLQNQFALSGLGRSGAIQEALAKAGAQISLPLAQQQSAQEQAINQQRFGQDFQLRSQQAGAEAQLSSLLNTLQGGQNTQYQQNLFGLNQQYPNIDIALRQAPLERLSAGLSTSDLQRQLDQQKFQTLLQSFLGVNQATPYGAQPTQTQTISGNVLTNNIAPFLAQQGLLGSLGQNNVFSGLFKGIGELAGGIGGLFSSSETPTQPSPPSNATGLGSGLDFLTPSYNNPSYNSNPFGSNPFSGTLAGGAYN